MQHKETWRHMPPLNLQRTDSRCGTFQRAAIVFSLTLLSILITFPNRSVGQDELLLRDLTFIRDVKVDSVDASGVKLDGDRNFYWDEIESALLSEKQAEFNQFHSRLSEPLFRLRSRLQNRDDKEALYFGKQLLPEIGDEKHESGLLVFNALTRGCIADQKREQAAVWLFRYVALLTELQNAKASLKHNELALPFDGETGFCNWLMPIWFENKESQKAATDLVALLKKHKSYPRSFHFYTASLAICAGDTDTMEKALSALPNKSDTEKALRGILQSQQDIAAGHADLAIDRLTQFVKSEVTHVRLMSHYYIGMAQKGGDRRERQQAALSFLKIHASYGIEYPTIAASALFHAANAIEADNERESAIIAEELRKNYPTSYHAKVIGK